MSRPLCIDLFCGLGGWAEGFLSEGWDVVGFDIERHEYMVPESMPEGNGGKGTKPVEKRGWTQGCAITMGMEGATQQPRTRLAKYPAQLVLQDVLTLHGSQFRNASAIVASPPCQKYSYMAMPWTRAKRESRWQCWERDSPFGDFRLNDLFDACFRIQREASEAAGHEIPMVVENVKGAQSWVGRARWHHGSFYLWGDVPALMPFAAGRKGVGKGKTMADGTGATSWFFQNRCDPRDGSVKGASENGRRTDPGKGARFTSRDCGIEAATGERDGVKQEGLSGPKWFDEGASKHPSKSHARKAASAQIAKIPPQLAEYIARVFKP